MQYSDDEYDSQSGFTSETGNVHNLSKAELRKTNKPIMEKKRRARINNCLNELKDLLLDAMNKDPAQHSKLEKADILELTVKHLQALQRQQLAAAVAADPAVLRRFRAGFGDCAVEVKRYLTRLAPPTPPGLPCRLGAHLSTCLDGIERLAPHRRARSAFRHVRGPASPPPSPASCDSACDSSTEPETPPRPAPAPPPATFPTPPSGSATDQDSSPETQRPTVSSTTETRARRAAADLPAGSSRPLSIVIDVDSFRMGIEASPGRPLDYRHRPKRSAPLHPGEESSAKVSRSSAPAATVESVTDEAQRVPDAGSSSRAVARSVISHTAASRAGRAAGAGDPGGAPARGPPGGALARGPPGAGDAMWRPW